MSVSTASVLDLTTEVLETKKMRIDGEEYDLLSFDHLTPEDEASVTATFARFQKVFARLETAKNDQAATVEASKLRKYRVRLIEQMTTVPRNVIDKLGPSKQGQVLRAIQDEISAQVDLSEDGDDGEPEEDIEA